MDGDDRRERLRSFVLGGVVGAAGAIAAARSRRPRRRQRPREAGLAAFEGAPCYREVVEREAEER
jgi:hypothetical protein